MRYSTRSMRPVQAIWLALALALTATCALVLASGWHLLTTPCADVNSCGATQLSTASAHTLQKYGVSTTAFAAYIEIAVAVVWSVWYGIAGLIIARKPDDRGAIVSGFFLILFPAVLPAVILPNSAPSGLYVPLASPGLCALPLFCLLFPDGRFRPWWTRWLALVGIASSIGVVAVSGVYGEVPWLVMILTGLGVQVYRYRAVSSWQQRQQTKWVLVGLAIALVGFVAIIVSYAFTWAHNGTIYAALSTSFIGAVPAAIPITIGIAMLRSRLWDVDRLINRALVYLALTGTLAVTYVASVLLLQTLLGAVIGHSSGITVALSTLGVAALFGPLRRGVQTGIDRRFYRDKYDAERALFTLGERLRDEVDLSRLSQELTSVVSETLHPEHVSLWVRPQ